MINKARSFPLGLINLLFNFSENTFNLYNLLESIVYQTLFVEMLEKNIDLIKDFAEQNKEEKLN